MIVVKLSINIQSEFVNNISSARIEFAGWLPCENEDKLVYKENNKTLNLWVDPSTQKYLSPDYNLEKDVNWPVSNINIEVHGFDDWLLNASTSKDKKQYFIELQNELYDFIINPLNRFITYVKFHKGQYWLKPYDLNHGNMVKFFKDANTKICLDGQEIDWPLLDDYATISSPIYLNSRFNITKKDWRNIEVFMNNKTRHSFILELLSRADLLVRNGFISNSIVDSYIAFEIAVENLCSKPKVKEIEKIINRELNPVTSLRVFNNVGLTAFCIYVLPNIFPVDIISKELQVHVEKFINLRQNIIHSRQKNFNDINAIELLEKIREYIMIIMNYTEK